MTSRLDQAEWKLDCLSSRMDALARRDEDPCWEGYEQAGTKEKHGATVPNCVKADASPEMQKRTAELAKQKEEMTSKLRDLYGHLQAARRGKEGLSDTTWRNPNIAKQIDAIAGDWKRRFIDNPPNFWKK